MHCTSAFDETSHAIDYLIASFESSNNPVAILNSNLEFIYRNGLFERLMDTYKYQRRTSMIDTFGAMMGANEVRRLIKQSRDPAHGYSWKGKITHRTKTAGSIITKALLMPFRPQGRDLPLAWTLLFDDITQENKSMLRDMFSSLLQASKLKDNDTGRHIERVNLYSELLARSMYGKDRWPEVDFDFVEHIGFLAAMHDVGKIGTPDDILNKKGPLNDFEWGIMKEHTINGSFILSSYPNPMAQQIAQSHHERFDGTGYPYNLEGEMIPLPARIVAIADVYDALRMKRSYKEPHNHQRTSLLILADRGKHFDPYIVDAYQKVQAGFALIFDDNIDK